MIDLEQLGREIASEQDRLPTRVQRRAEVRARLLLQRDVSRKSRPFFRRYWVPLVAAVCASVTVMLLWTAARQRPLTVAVGQARVQTTAGTWIDAPETRSLPLFFSDGTFIEMAPRSRARVLELTEHGASMLLERGRARVEVAHRPGQQWRVATGAFTVRVTGTRFDLGYSPEADRFELILEEGQVELSGCVFGSGRRLVAGQRVEASCKTPRLDVAYNYNNSFAVPAAPSVEPQTHAPLDATGALPSPSGGALANRASTNESTPAAALGRPPTPETSARNVWVKLAKQGMYAEAFATADASGFESECHRASAAELVLLADVARHAGHLNRARLALSTLRQRFPGSKEAEVATFSLGLIEFDGFREYAKAADWFGTYLRERPSGRLAQEAKGRRMEAMHRVGNHEVARNLASEYLLDYPAGPHAELARRVASSP